MRSSSVVLLAIALIASIVLFAYGMRTKSGEVCAIAAFLGLLAILAASLRANALQHADATPFSAASTNSALISAAYAWGGLALLVGYGASEIRWQHGWQYGSGMLVIAAAIAFLSRQMSVKRGPGAGRLLASADFANLAQAAASMAGLIFLIGSGKLASGKADWPANQIFLAGGVLIFALSLLAARTHRRLNSG